MRQLKTYIILLSLLVPFALQGNNSHPKKLKFDLLTNKEGFLGKTAIAAFSQILSKHDLSLETVTLPSKRGLEELRRDRLDGTMGRVGNLSQILGKPDLIRIDFPIVAVTISMWCRKGIEADTHSLNLGYPLGTVAGTLLMSQINKKQVRAEEIRTFHGLIQMFNEGRIDCFILDDTIIESQGLLTKPYTRHDLITVQAFPWISKRYAYLKIPLEQGLREYPFPRRFRETFLQSKPACHLGFETLCPDGIVFTKKVDLKSVSTVSM